MPDVAHTLAKEVSSRGTQPKAHVGLRATITLIAVLICFVVVILWCRSYTWRDRMVVPLGDSWFCRFDSDRGKLEYESYGPNMGEMTFSITSLSHADISNAWRRFTDAPQPGPGKQWRWERWDTGRFFIHVPHWFLVGLALMLASVPWLPWRFSFHALLIAIAVLAVILGLLLWTNAPSPMSDENVASEPTTKGSSTGQAQNLDFATLLYSIDDAIGKRIQSPRIEAMDYATYQYNGPIEKVLAIVAPIAKKSGFSEETGALDVAVASQMRNLMANGVLKVVDFKTFTHPNGDILTICSMAVGKTGIKMLTITYMNPDTLPSVGENLDSHE